MKRLIIFILLLTSNVFASEEECNGRFINNRCLTISPFDVSFSKYNEGFSLDALYDGQGNDWDNNGLIDMLEDTLFISHTNGYIKEN